MYQAPTTITKTTSTTMNHRRTDLLWYNHPYCYACHTDSIHLMRSTLDLEI
jgi:hypothetical protein